MTENPVAAANARTMWKSEMPATPAISSRVSCWARWLSINQSARWAGFMGRPSFEARALWSFAGAAFDSPCSASGRAKREPDANRFFRLAENSSEAVAGNTIPIVHTEAAFSPTAQRPAPQRGCLSFGQHVREDDDAPPCLELRQILMPCGNSRACGRQRCRCTEEIRSRCDRYRDQDRKHHALFGAGLEGLGDQASKLIIIETSYETTSPTLDSQVVQMKTANPDILVNITPPKFAAQAHKKIGELKWNPIHFLTNVSASVGSVMNPG